MGRKEKSSNAIIGSTASTSIISKRTYSRQPHCRTINNQTETNLITDNPLKNVKMVKLSIFISEIQHINRSRNIIINKTNATMGTGGEWKKFKNFCKILAKNSQIEFVDGFFFISYL